MSEIKLPPNEPDVDYWSSGEVVQLRHRSGGFSSELFVPVVFLVVSNRVVKNIVVFFWMILESRRG